MSPKTNPHHQIKCIIEHLRIAEVLRNPCGPLPAGYQIDDLVFLVRYADGIDGKPIKDDAYMSMDAVAGTTAFQQYVEYFLTPCVGRVIGIHSLTKKEVVIFADSETVRRQHEQYMNSVKSNQLLKRKKVGATPDQNNVKKLRHSDSAPSIKSKSVIKEWNERLALAGQKGNTFYHSDVDSVHSKSLGNSSSKSSDTLKSLFTIRKAPESPMHDTEHNSSKASSMEIFPYLIKKDNRYSPFPSQSESDESVHASASFKSAPLDFIDTFGADEPTMKKWNCTLM